MSFWQRKKRRKIAKGLIINHEKFTWVRQLEVDKLIDNCQLILQEKTEKLVRYRAEKEAYEEVADTLFNKLQEAEAQLVEKERTLERLRAMESKISNPQKAVSDIQNYIAMSDKQIEKEANKIKNSLKKKMAKKYGL